MGQYEKDKAELLEKIEKLEHKLKKAKQEGDKDDVDKYSRKLADRRAKLASLEPRGLPRRRRRRHGDGGDGRFIALHGARRPLGPRRAVGDEYGAGPPRRRRDV